MRKIRLPHLGRRRRKAPETALTPTLPAIRAPRAPEARHRAPEPSRAAQPSFRGRSRLKYGPDGRPSRTREHLADRADRKPPTMAGYGYRQTPASDRPEARTRPYPAPKVSNLRVRPMVRAGARHQLGERRDELAASRARKPPQGIAVPTARQQLAQRPKHGVQAHTYPEPYDRRKPPTLPPTGRRSRSDHPARGAAPRPPAGLPGDVTPTTRIGGARAGGAHPYWSKR